MATRLLCVRSVRELFALFVGVLSLCQPERGEASCGNMRGRMRSPAGSPPAFTKEHHQTQKGCREVRLPDTQNPIFKLTHACTAFREATIMLAPDVTWQILKMDVLEESALNLDTAD